ncbi:MAG: LysM peptidoglycan-binding domain-containing protein [Clostridia bacterium]|nr:LysM peptidoglycan-binding domain-containing protein [Clostridia bacterium]
MKLKVVNKKRFLRGTIILFVVMFFFVFNIKNKSLSEGIQNYKTITVTNGDTLWSIAQYEQSENDYYKDTDIREIIYNIKSLNNLKSSNLSVNQNLKIPVNI